MTALADRLEAAWLCQLAREHSDICAQYRLVLSTPVFALTDDHRRLGSWSAEERRLCLSRHLIKNHPWSLTLQVLKHEMAHQLVSERGGDDRQAHGPGFRLACLELGLAAPFHRAGADLSEALAVLAADPPENDPGRRLLARVRKLLALGESDNQHEASLALRRAGELLAGHRLDFAALAADQGLVHRTIETGCRTMPIHRKAICSLLAEHFGVRVICASLYNPAADRSFKTIELLGREEQVAIARHCYHFLEDHLERWWRKRRHGFAANSRVARKSAFLGLVAGFRESLGPAPEGRGTRAAESGTSRELILVEERQLDDFVAFRFPRLRRLHGRKSILDRSAYSQAAQDGRGLSLRRPLPEAGTPRLLPEETS